MRKMLAIVAIAGGTLAFVTIQAEASYTCNAAGYHKSGRATAGKMDAALAQAIQACNAPSEARPFTWNIRSIDERLLRPFAEAKVVIKAAVQPCGTLLNR